MLLNGIYFLIANCFGIMTRLYVLSIFAVAFITTGNVLGIFSLSAYNHEAIGALMAAGVIWFVTLIMNVVVFAGINQPVDRGLGKQSLVPDAPNLPNAMRSEINTVAK
jgi:hypothetical protein